MTSLSDDLRDLIEHDRAQARRLLLDLVAALPRSVDARQLLADSYLRSLEYDLGAQTYREILALDPSDSLALHHLGFCQLAQGEDAAALEAYHRATAATASANSVTIAAALLHRVGRQDEAVGAHANLLGRLQKDSPELQHLLRGAVMVMRDAGRLREADDYARALVRVFDERPLTISSRMVERGQALGFHEWRTLVDKARLAHVLQKALGEDPTGARVPPTFTLPDQRDALARFATAEPRGALFIVKPTRGSGGQGISVESDLTGVTDRPDVIVQRYVERPYLVDGRKGHLRIYALITSVEPLRAYVYSEGIVRFAPAAYDLSPGGLADIAMHVTNTALHLGHPELVISEDPSRDDEGAIWSLSALFRRMQADGRDTDAVFGEIETLVGWFLRHLRRDGFFARQAARAPARSYAPKLFGLDILLDADGHPWLLEIQTSPAATGTPLVSRISGELFTTIFHMGIAPLDIGDTADEAAIARRELEIEQAHRGAFRPLDLED